MVHCISEAKYAKQLLLLPCLLWSYNWVDSTMVRRSLILRFNLYCELICLFYLTFAIPYIVNTVKRLTVAHSGMNLNAQQNRVHTNNVISSLWLHIIKQNFVEFRKPWKLDSRWSWDWESAILLLDLRSNYPSARECKSTRAGQSIVNRVRCTTMVTGLKVCSFLWFAQLRTWYHALEVTAQRGSNSWPPDHDNTFHVLEMPGVATRASVTSYFAWYLASSHIAVIKSSLVVTIMSMHESFPFVYVPRLTRSVNMFWNVFWVR